jgi:hypothetical protein
MDFTLLNSDTPTELINEAIKNSLAGNLGIRVTSKSEKELLKAFWFFRIKTAGPVVFYMAEPTWLWLKHLQVLEACCS